MVETLNAFAFLRQLMGTYFCGWLSKIRTFSCKRKKINEGNQEKKAAKKKLITMTTSLVMLDQKAV